MISAYEAKEMVNQYYTNKEEERKQAAIHKLEIINDYIKTYAQSGMSTLRINDRVSFFKESQVEEFAVEELKKLGYKVDTSNGHLVVRWSN